MSLIRKPSELSVNAHLSALIYGNPGAGKTTLACSAPSPILFDFDGGVNRIDANHQVPTVQVSSWEDTLAAMDEVEQKHPEFKTIVIDTVGKMLLYMEDYIKRTMAPSNTALTMRDGSLSLKGFGARKQMFIDFNNRLKMAGRDVVYVAHEVEKNQRKDKNEITVKRPEVGGSSGNDLMKELDLVGYLQLYDNKRVITFDPQETFYAKNSCGIYGVVEIPVLLDSQGNPTCPNDYMGKVVEGFRARLERNKQMAMALEKTKAIIEENAAEMESAKDVADFARWCSTGVQHVFNSKAYAQQLADSVMSKLASAVENASQANELMDAMLVSEEVLGGKSAARTAFSARCKALGLKFDKMTKTYSDGDAA